jgi:mycothiol synthase
MAATARLIQAGYEEIYLRTDDHRLPAIKTYLKLGWEPFLCAPDMAERWRTVCQQLNWQFSIERER